MRVLHVAALPFPSPQGTQALLHAMLMAHAQAGHDAHLLCYPGRPVAVPYRVHRCAPPRPVSLRSGPSWHKLALDGALAWSLRKLVRRLRPELVVAHHVEAAAIALALRIPAAFYAHTDLGAELPSYFAPHWRLPLRLLGAGLDRVLSAMPTLAVSPLLAQKMGAQLLPLPWAIPPPISERERREARAHFALSGRVVLYAGNLDRYQGLEPVIAAVAREEVQWLIATESPLRDFARALHPFFGRVRFARLHDEAARRRAYAAADLAVVPRAVPGGVPIKLFDALARGVPVVTTRTALAGYPLARFCNVIEREWTFQAPHADARAYLQAAHAPARFAAELSAWACQQGAARA